MNRRILLMQILKILAKIGWTNKFFPLGTKFAKMLLPDEYEITVGSYRMNINPKEDLGLYFGYKEVELGVPDLLKKIIKKGELFIDVGAYKGFYSLIASELVGEDGKVLAFEPNYKFFEILVKNIKLNSISNIIALNIALSDFDGKASFVDAGLGSHLGDGDELVEVRTLDSVMNSLALTPKRYKKIIIKIDVEGAEYSVLKGSVNTLNEFKPRLLIEIHHNADFRLFDFLVSMGYTIGLVEDDNVTTFTLEEIKKRCLERRRSKFGTIINQHIYCEVIE